MTISYPLSTPTNIGIANITLSAENAVAISQSPFTYQQQVVAHPGQRWAASISLPPMKRPDAEYWVAFLLSLKGQIGTFLLGDPNCVAAQGSATARRNILAYSEQLDNAYWNVNGGAVTANAETAPNSTVTADNLVENTVNTGHYLGRNISWVSGTTYTLSVYVKRPIGSVRNFRLSFPFAQFGGTSAAFFDTSTGAVISTDGGVTTTTETLANGWFRFSISKAAAASATDDLRFSLVLGTSNFSYTGDGTSSLSFWGAQLEVGSSPTAYQGVVATYGPLVNGGSQVGDTLIIDSCSPSVTGFLLPGDYIQLGSSTTTQLYKVLTQVDTDASGNATLDLWPNLRTSPADNAAITVANTKGRFRLKDNVTQWGINEISSYGITFDCVEAI
jgi:hypothetical protein